MAQCVSLLPLCLPIFPLRVKDFGSLKLVHCTSFTALSAGSCLGPFSLRQRMFSEGPIGLEHAYQYTTRMQTIIVFLEDGASSAGS
jgi:hypothetical protein